VRENRPSPSLRKSSTTGKKEQKGRCSLLSERRVLIRVQEGGRSYKREEAFPSRKKGGPRIGGGGGNVIREGTKSRRVGRYQRHYLLEENHRGEGQGRKGLGGRRKTKKRGQGEKGAISFFFLKKEKKLVGKGKERPV